VSPWRFKFCWYEGNRHLSHDILHQKQSTSLIWGINNPQKYYYDLNDNVDQLPTSVTIHWTGLLDWLLNKEKNCAYSYFKAVKAVQCELSFWLVSLSVHEHREMHTHARLLGKAGLYFWKRKMIKATRLCPLVIHIYFEEGGKSDPE
jgi:hypothetical protein